MDTTTTFIPGNTDPWAGPTDPAAVARELRRFKATRDPRAARADGAASVCGCWRRDCDDCGHRLADGQRPARGSVTRFWKATR